MLHVQLILSYLGTKYTGWQNGIKKAVEETLEKILQESISLEAASRTDAGVHAEGQVASFTTQRETIDLPKLHRGLNGLLPKDISVRSLSIVPPEFHPTLDALAKQYDYSICFGPVQLPFHRHISWHFPYPLDLIAMRSAASALIGMHDFSTFANEKTGPGMKRSGQCRLDQILIEPQESKRLLITVIGRTFLYKMVRNIVGTLAYVGCGKISPEAIPQILSSGERPRAGVTAPAHGLILKKVFYPGIDQMSKIARLQEVNHD